MALPIISGTIRVTVAGQLAAGGFWNNTWHARHLDLSGWEAAEIQGFHDIFRQLYIGPPLSGGTSVLANCHSSTTTQYVYYLPLDGLSLASTIPMINTGSASGGNPLPPEVAEVLTLRTNNRGRSYRGRIYLPAFTTSQATTGVITAAAINGITTQFNAVQTALRTGGGELGVASYKLSIFTPIQSVSMDPLFDVVRGRKT
jgi:hypothetical protein